MAYISQNGLYIACHKIQVWYNFLSHVSSLFAPLRSLPILLRIRSKSYKTPHPADVISCPQLPPSCFLNMPATLQPWVFALGVPSAWNECILCSYTSFPSVYSWLFWNVTSSRIQPSQLHLLSVALHLLICLDSKCNYLAVQHLLFIAHPPQFPPECE